MSERVAKTPPPVVFCACKTGCQLAMVGGEGLGAGEEPSGPRAQDGGRRWAWTLRYRSASLGRKEEASGSLGMDLGRRRVDGHPRLDDRAPRRAASWRRRRAGGLGPASSTGVTVPTLGTGPAAARAQ